MWLPIGILISILVSITGIFLAVFLIEVTGGTRIMPVLSGKQNDWHILTRHVTASEYCDPESGQNVSLCLASPENPTLWTSPILTNEPEQREKVVALKGKEFWIGKVILTQELKKSFQEGANHLVFGLFAGRYEVWIDGSFLTAGRANYGATPLSIRIPINRLGEENPLYLAIKIEHELDTVFPELFSLVYQEGFATQANAEKFLRFLSFYPALSVSLVFAFNLMLGLLFFSLWLMKRKRQEFGFMAFFAIVFSLSQVFQSDINLWMESKFGFYLNAVVLSFEGGSAILLAGAFARFKKVFFSVTIPLFFILTITAVVTLRFSRISMDLPANLPAWLSFWYVPVCYLVGAFFCFLQFYTLIPMNFGGKAIFRRMQDLAIFGIALALIGFSYSLSAHSTLSLGYSHLHSFFKIALVLVLSFVLLREWYYQSQFVTKVPISSYHRNPIMPEKIDGALIHINLKQTDYLLRYQPTSKKSTDIIHECLTLLWSAAADYGGTIIETEGDSLVAFFENTAITPSLDGAINAALLAKKELEELESQIRKSDPIHTQNWHIGFRAAISVGSIKPVWQTVLDARYASWEGVGEKNPFTEASKFLEFGRKMTADNTTDSIVFLHEEVAQKAEDFLSKIGFTWLFRDLPIAGKIDSYLTLAAAALPRAKQENFDDHSEKQVSTAIP